MSPYQAVAADRVELSPAAQQRLSDARQQVRWQAEQDRYLAQAFTALNLDSAGVLAARRFYANAAGKDAGPQMQLRFVLTAAVEPLTQKQHHSSAWLEVIRQVPPGAFGPIELQTHRPDDVWLEIAPESAILTALTDSKEPRTLTHKVPLKITRLPSAAQRFASSARFPDRSPCRRQKLASPGDDADHSQHAARADSRQHRSG